MVVSKSFLYSTRRMVGSWLERCCWMDEKWLWSIFAVVESWLEGGMNDGQDKDGYSADEGFSVG